MKKLITVLLTALMVVTLGVVNIAGEEDEKVREDALSVLQTASTLLADVSNDSLEPRSIKYVVDGKEVNELPKESHTLNLFELDAKDRQELATTHVIVSDEDDASLLIDYLYSQFAKSGKERYKNVFKRVCGKHKHNHDISCYAVFLPLTTQKYFTIDDISMADGDKEMELSGYYGEIYAQMIFDGKDHINTIDIDVNLDGVDLDCKWYQGGDAAEKIFDAGAYTTKVEINDYLYLDGDLYSGFAAYSYAFVVLDIIEMCPLFVANDLYGDYYLISTDSILTLNNKKGEVLIGNYDDAIAAGATGVEYTLDGETWNEALVKTYVDKDGKKLHYIELALGSEDADQTSYEIRFKTAEESANNFSTSQFNVDSKEYAQDFNNLPSLEFYKGKPKENEILVSYNVDEKEYEDLVPYEFSEEDFIMTGCYPTYVSVGNNILEYGEDYVLCVYGDKEENNGLLGATVEEPYMSIRFTDDYLKSLKTGTHNFRLHIGFVESEFDYYLLSTFSYFDGQIKVKKHHVPDDDTPSYKVVATGIE